MKGDIEIQNLKCGGCATTIKNKIDKTEGIESVSVDVETSTLSFEYTNEIQYKNVVKVLSDIGYPVVGAENNLTSKAKSFVSCAVGKMQK